MCNKQNTSVCASCDLFDCYDTDVPTDISENNCYRWLCNDGSCPHEKELVEKNYPTEAASLYPLGNA